MNNKKKIRFIQSIYGLVIQVYLLDDLLFSLEMNHHKAKKYFKEYAEDYLINLMNRAISKSHNVISVSRFDRFVFVRKQEKKVVSHKSYHVFIASTPAIEFYLFVSPQ